MEPGRTRFLVTALVVGVALLGAATLKQRAARRSLPEAMRALPPGSAFVVPAAPPKSSVPDTARARVATGPPRMYHLDPARTNRSPFPGPIDPQVVWSHDTGAPIETAPALLDDGTVVVGTLGGDVVGITKDGKRAFATRLADRVYASPLVVGTRVFVGSDDDKLFALGPGGAIRWSLETGADTDTGPTVRSDGVIVFAAGDTVVAVRQDGTVVWRVRAKRKLFSSPAVGSDDAVYVGAQDDRLYSIGRDGKVRFSVALGADVDCAPALADDGRVFVGTDGGAVVAVEPESGKVVWRTQVGGHVRGGLTLTRGHSVIAGVYGPTPRVVSLDGRTGESIWSFSVPGTGAAEFGVHGSPVEAQDGSLYFGAQDDTIYALTSTGDLMWKLATGGDVDAPVVLGGPGVLYAASDDGKVYRIEDRAVLAGGGDGP